MLLAAAQKERYISIQFSFAFNLKMALNDFRYLWDGSEAGWKLMRIEKQKWRLTFMFAASGLSLQEIYRLRSLLDEFRNIPINVVLTKLRGQAIYLLPRNLSNLEMHSLME
jgi:hypothetical protein